MLYKKPVIGTSVGGIPEVIGDAGYIIEPKNSARLAERIICLFEHPEKAEELGEKGFSQLKNCFPSLQMAKEYYSLINN